MDDQQQKQDVESDAQKRAGAPASDPAGKQAPDRKSDKDAALGIDSGRRAQREKPWNERQKSESL